MKHFDVIVVGGGHAGTEAADVAARMGAKVGLLTMRADRIGVMSCNPAIGGLGKGHLVREIDALDGIMARAADRAGIQFRLLNRSKGPAVQGPRLQADRSLYRQAVQEMLAGRSGLEIIEGEAAGLLLHGTKIAGVELSDGTSFSAASVVLTAGTFLNGVLHVGPETSRGGRVGDPASDRLAAVLADIAPGRGRLKTGTPPRLDGRSIDWSALELQAGDDRPVMLSFLDDRPFVRQISCGVTHTNSQTHEIVRANLGKSAMYGGHIEGVGPRYCPSIEDKIVRFSDKESHQVFLEPEGLDDDTVYPNGISTSLPADVQEAYVRSIRGLESARILQPGYAIEYDYFDPCGLTRGLRLREVDGLFFAGQINGTTGYEEAAAQGLLAGLNAARASRGEDEIVLQRTQSYLGVMIDDLVTRGVTEPYRMFTSRAEYRLSLRVDNADQRLTPLGIALGCIGNDRAVAFDRKMQSLGRARDRLTAAAHSPNELEAVGLTVNRDGVRRTAFDLLAFPGVTEGHLGRLVPDLDQIEPAVLEQLKRESLYARYENRQTEQIAALRKDEAKCIPHALDYRAIPGLSAELRGKLERVRPETLAQAARIEGITPAALALIHLALGRSDGMSARGESA